MRHSPTTPGDRRSMTFPSAPFLSMNFKQQSSPKHVAIIMDGNRRWARSRGLPDICGHRAGAAALEALLPAVAETDIEVLTLFGFATANWQRSRFEVDHLLELLETKLTDLSPRCLRESIAVEVIGRKDRLPRTLLRAIDRTERATANGRRRLRIAFDYSSRDEILNAARSLPADGDRAAFAARLSGRVAARDVDLLIRTGKEQRLSDFLLWECAFAELYFPDLYWPDFDQSVLARALVWYRGRERRMGR
jgi:undecaprenyl diphosphate synthase